MFHLNAYFLCPFQQVLQIYFQYVSMIYIIYMEFIKKKSSM